MGMQPNKIPIKVYNSLEMVQINGPLIKFLARASGKPLPKQVIWRHSPKENVLITSDNLCLVSGLSSDLDRVKVCV